MLPEHSNLPEVRVFAVAIGKSMGDKISKHLRPHSKLQTMNRSDGV